MKKQKLIIKETPTYKKNDYKSYALEDFILQNQIGLGSFGKIYKVKDKKTGEILVAKISINKIEEDSVNQLLDISREVNILSKINHPSVLKFIFYSPLNFKGKPKPVIITEFAINGSLEELFKKREKINMTQKLIIIYGIASAMSFLHNNDIIHRDLKPANILLDQYLFPKIADFGLSKFSQKSKENLTMKSAVAIKGTPIYMSPEIWYEVKYTKSCDVYAFAMIVYEIITELKPFDKFSIFQIPIEIEKGYRPMIRKNIAKSYKNIIEECWSQDPTKRPSFDEISDRLINDRGFITKDVNEVDFFNYVNYIKECKSSFNETKNVFYFDLYNRVKKEEKDEPNQILYNLSLFSYKEYCKLDEECRNLVDKANEDPEKQYDIAVSLIESHGKFQQNTQVGIKYLKKSIEKNCIKSIIYYCEMLIKGKIIRQNFDKAIKLINKKLKNHISTYLLML